MGILNYKRIRGLLFIVCSMTPFFIVFILQFMKFPLIGNFVFGLVIALMLALLGYWVTGANSWVKAIQGDSVLVMDVNSTGVGKVYNAKVVTNPFGGIDLNIQFGKETETLAYDRRMAHRVQAPVRGLMSFFSGSKKEGALEKVVFTIDNDTYEKAAWHYDYLTFFFYDSQLGTLLVKPYMGEQEKELMSEYINLNEWRETKNLCKQMEALTNHMFNLLGQNISRLWENPIVKFFAIALVVIVIGLVVVMFVPGAADVLFPAVDGAAKGNIAPLAPITGGNVPIGGKA
jgi:hypothetical protein